MLTTTQIRSLTRRQLIWHLEQDLKGGELFMKEVWEACETASHVSAAERELRDILDWLREREREDAED